MLSPLDRLPTFHRASPVPVLKFCEERVAQNITKKSVEIQTCSEIHNDIMLEGDNKFIIPQYFCHSISAIW
jgi:hypothetical protein